MEKFEIVCPCLFGLESELAFEMKRLGFDNVKSQNGRVTFTGDFQDVATANIWLRTAERVLINLSTFTANSFEELFDNVSKIPFEIFIDKYEAFPVKGFSLNSTLKSIPDCQAIIKKAVAMRMQKHHNISWFEETGAVCQIQFSIMKDEVCIMLDTSGAPLHKRGYRKKSSEAPIKETLAAGILSLARIREDSVVYDPFCGSGTFLIESSLKAMNIAPGINRTFSVEKWRICPDNLFSETRLSAKNRVNRDVEFAAYGYDIDENALNIARENVKIAGVSDKVVVRKRDVRDFSTNHPNVTIICNPPYGERLLELQEAHDLYREMSQVFLSEHNIYIITADDDFEEIFAKKSDRRRKLYNGMMKCQLYMYFNNKR